MFDALRRFAGSFLPQVRASDALDAGRSTRHREDKAFRKSLPMDSERSIGAWQMGKARLECRDLALNSPLVSGLIELLARYVPGPEGLIPQAKTADGAWNEAAEAYFSERCKIMDYRGRTDFAGLQKLAVTTRMTDGIVFFLMTDTGQLQPIEAERVGTPSDKHRDSNIINGCKVDPTGRILGWYVAERSQSGGVDSTKWEFVEARDMIVLTSPFRFDQIFGIPDLASVCNAIKDFDDYQLSTLLTARLQSRQAMAIKTAQGAGRASMSGGRDATASTEEKRVKVEYDGYTQKHYLGRDEDAVLLGSPTPGPQFESYSVQQMRMIYARFGIPYDVGQMDFQRGSFAQSKAALSMFYAALLPWQVWLRNYLCQRVWNWTIARGIKYGDLPPAPVDGRGYSTWYNVTWTFPGRDWIDPQDAVDAEIKEFNLGKTNLAEIVAKTGRDVEDVLRSKAKEMQMAEKIEKEFGMKPGTLIQPFSNMQQPQQQGQNQGNRNER